MRPLKFCIARVIVKLNLEQKAMRQIREVLFLAKGLDETKTRTSRTRKDVIQKIAYMLSFYVSWVNNVQLFSIGSHVLL